MEEEKKMAGMQFGGRFEDLGDNHPSPDRFSVWK